MLQTRRLIARRMRERKRGREADGGEMKAGLKKERCTPGRGGVQARRRRCCMPAECLEPTTLWPAAGSNHTASRSQAFQKAPTDCLDITTCTPSRPGKWSHLSSEENSPAAVGRWRLQRVRRCTPRPGAVVRYGSVAGAGGRWAGATPQRIGSDAERRRDDRHHAGRDFSRAGAGEWQGAG